MVDEQRKALAPARPSQKLFDHLKAMCDCLVCKLAGYEWNQHYPDDKKYFCGLPDPRYEGATLTEMLGVGKCAKVQFVDTLTPEALVAKLNGKFPLDTEYHESPYYGGPGKLYGVHIAEGEIQFDHEIYIGNKAKRDKIAIALEYFSGLEIDGGFAVFSPMCWTMRIIMVKGEV